MTHSRTPRPSGAGHTILLADDEPGIRDVVRRVLERNGYRVLAAQDGAEALALSQAHPGDIDVLLTDMEMGDMTGQELEARLRVLRPQVCTVIMSGYAERRRRGTTPPGESPVLLAKPFEPKALVTVLQRLLGD